MRIDDLSDEEKRVLIAEFCGLYWHPEEQHEVVPELDYHGNLHGNPYTLHRCKCGASRFSCSHAWQWDSKHEEAPDYLNSLDAIAEAEKMLNQEQWDDYISALLENDKHPGTDRDGNKTDEYDIWRIVGATARQRADALLTIL